MKAVRNVLIVEDVPEMSELIRVALEGAGYRVSGTAQNTWEARLELGRRRPDLLLLDELLPGESSTEIIQEIAGNGPLILLMTGMSDRNAPLPNGVLGRIVKPDENGRSDEIVRFIETLEKLTGKV